MDDEIQITINVTNVDEEGELTLNSSHPEVDKAIVASLSDPDGVDLSNDNKINWVISRNSDPNSGSWIEISDTETTSKSFEYTPVAADAGTYLQFKATYRDRQDSGRDRTKLSWRYLPRTARQPSTRVRRPLELSLSMPRTFTT